MLLGSRLFMKFCFFLLLGLAALVNTGSAQTLSVTTATMLVTIHPGDKNIPLTVNVGSSSYSGPVSVTLTGLPSGITASPLTLAPEESGTLKINASVSADQGAFSALGVNTVTTPVTVLAFAGAMQATANISLTVSLENPSYNPAPDQINLPIVNINTGGIAIVDKTTNVPGTITITSADGQTSYLPSSANPDNTATFQLHGNSTILMPKKPYKVKFNTSLDLLTAMGLSCPYVNGSGQSVCDKSKSYILLANYDDKTFLRDWSASALANAIPNGGTYLSYSTGAPSPTGTSALGWWAPHSLFVELYLNGEYEGNYQLIEEVKVDSHRVNINEMDDTDISGKSLTGGYLLEIDRHQTEDFIFTTPQNVDIGLEDPDFSPEVPEQITYINSYMNTAEAALFGSSYTDPTLGWRAYFDEASAVNFYIVNDIMGNVDGGDFFSSDYLYKDKNNPLLYMGPVWDFDISAGNVNYEPILNPTIPWMQTNSSWYAQWFTDPSFKAAVIQQWNALKNGGVFTSWLSSINQQAALLQQAQANNFGRWPMQGIQVWPNAVAVGSYTGEVSYLTNWINLRMGYLDAELNNKASTTTSLAVPTGTLRTGVDVTLNAQVTGGNSPGGSVTFMCNSIVLGTATLDSSGAASLTSRGVPAGTDMLQAVYNGDSTNGLSASTPISVDTLPPLIPTATNHIVSADSILLGTPVTLTAAVVATSGTTVSAGSFTYSSNGVVLGTAPVLPNGTAAFSTTALSSGVNLIHVSYSGDATYRPSVSNTTSVTVLLPTANIPLFSLAAGTYQSTQTLTISDVTPGAAIYYTVDDSVPTTNSTLYTAAITISHTQTVKAIAVASGYNSSAVANATYTIPPSFDMDISPPSQTISPGQSAKFTATITPRAGFAQSVAFSCSGLPVGDTCTFSPAITTPSSAPITSTLVISTGGMAGIGGRPITQWTKCGLGVIAALLLWPFRIRRVRLLAILFVFGIGSFIITACSGERAPTSVISIGATGGGVSQTGMVSLTVQR